MKIGIVGLGLMGGSILKAIKARTSHECWAYNRTKSVLDAAALYLDGVLDTNTIKDVDIVFVCLMPKATIDFVFKNAENFKKGCIVTDICGVKKHIVENLEKPLQSIGVHFVGAHPMAGKEVSGFCNSSEDLFNNASFILTPTARTDKKAVETLEKLAFEIGFKSVVKASPEEHDEIIAYTSQLAHIVSNAYVKSPKLSRHAGFSAGSFQDLTRVARLDSKMWTELFLLNRAPLLNELALIIKNLSLYKDALENDKAEMLCELLEAGNRLKIDSLIPAQ